MSSKAYQNFSKLPSMQTCFFFPLSDHQRRAFDVPLHSASLRVTTITLDIRSPALPAPRAEMEWALQFRACKFSLPCPRLPLPSITHDLTIITTQIANPQHHFTLVRTIKPLSLTALSLSVLISWRWSGACALLYYGKISVFWVIYYGV